MWLSSLETGSACGSRERVTGTGEGMIRQKKKGIYVYASHPKQSWVWPVTTPGFTLCNELIHHGMWSDKYMHVINICAPADRH